MGWCIFGPEVWLELRQIDGMSYKKETRVVFRYPSVHGAFLFKSETLRYTVRCVFKESLILRCDSVRFSDIVSPTVRFRAVIYLTVRFGAVLKDRKSYGAIRCGFQKSEIFGSHCGFPKPAIPRCGSVWFSDIVSPTVRFAAVPR